MQLRPIAAHLWEATGTHAMGPLTFPLRMVVWRTNQQVALWSPIAFEETLAKAIEELGTVSAVFAPNCAHHVHLQPWLTRFPDAQLVGPEGLSKKRPDLSVTMSVEEAASEFQETLSLQRIEGAPQMNEFALLHRPSRSLVVADLVFNIQSADGWLSRSVFKMSGTYGKLEQSKLWRWAIVKDRARAAESAQRILDWQFDRIVVAHGDIAEGAGPGDFAQATRWMLDAP